MKKRKSVVLKSVANAAYYVANRDANSVCCFFYHQPKLPEKVTQLRKK